MATVSLKTKAYNYIKDKIIGCEYSPGQVLVETEIIEAIGASRTPIREALNRLEQEGLVRIMSKRGVFVTEITISTVCDVYDVRELVEPYLVKEYASHISMDKICELYNRIETMDGSETAKEHYEFDNNLHQLFSSYCNNTYLKVMMEQIYGQNHRIRLLSDRASQSRLLESNVEHKRILSALLDQDYLKAANEMQRHLQIAREVAFAAITQLSNIII